MNPRFQKFRYALAILIGAVLGIAYFLSVIAANADTSASQVSINQNGLVMVRGAVITSVHGNRLDAIVQWGQTRMMWHIITTGSTRFQPQIMSRDMEKEFMVGDLIGFTGALDTTTAQPTLYAASIRNESLIQSSMTMQGSVLSANDSSFVILTVAGTTSITTSTGTIMTMNGDPITPRNLQPGDSVSAFGTYDVSRQLLVAERVTAASATPQQEPPATVQKNSIFSGIWRWIGMGRALSLR